MVCLHSCLAYPIQLLVLAAFLPRRNYGSFFNDTRLETTAPEKNSSTGVNVGFEQWISDALDEIISPKSLEIKGSIPPYVVGNLIRNGGGTWSIDQYTLCGHIFDGLAKLSHYSIDGRNNTVQFMSRFINSRLYDEWVLQGNGIPTIHLGPLVDKKTMKSKPQRRWVRAAINAIWFDNTPVNVWVFSPQTKSTDRNNSNDDRVWFLTDNPVRAIVDKNTGITLQTAKQPQSAQNAPGFYEVTGAAHPEYCKLGTGSTYNVGTQISFPYFQLCLTKESPDGTRTVVGKYPLKDNRIPYIHSFGLTPTKAIVVLQPLRQNSNVKKVLTHGFMPTMDHVDKTIVIVFDLETGDVLADTTLPENVYFYHTISATDTSDDEINTVSLRLCGYRVPDMITGPDMFLLFDRAHTKDGRNRIPKNATICDITVYLGTVDRNHDPKKAKASIQWIPVIDVTTNTEQTFELATTRYSRTVDGNGPWSNNKHPRYVYAYGAYAYGSSEYDSWTVYKIDTLYESKGVDDKTRAPAISFRENDKPDSCYYSECIFVPDPHGTDEDDGVLLLTRFDGRTGITSLLVVNAKTMSKAAEAETGIRVPMDFHGAFFPVKSSNVTL